MEVLEEEGRSFSSFFVSSVFNTIVSRVGAGGRCLLCRSQPRHGTFVVVQDRRGRGGSSSSPQHPVVSLLAAGIFRGMSRGECKDTSIYPHLIFGCIYSLNFGCGNLIWICRVHNKECRVAAVSQCRCMGQDRLRELPHSSCSSGSLWT